MISLGSDVSFRFAGDKVKNLQFYVFGRRLSYVEELVYFSSLSRIARMPPVLGYVDAAHIEKLRVRSLIPLPTFENYPNGPSFAIFRHRLNHLRPTDPVCEPFIVASLVSMAQVQYDTYRKSTLDQKASVLSNQVFTVSSPLPYHQEICPKLCSGG